MTSTGTHEPAASGEAPGATTDRELFDAGCAYLEGGDIALALDHLRRVYANNPNSARVRSYYGLCLGLAERCFEEARDLCESAAKQEFFNPDLYLNLARLHLGFGFKAEGVRYLRRGLMIDPGNAGLEITLRELGDRGAPVIRFLPRKHPLNRWLGAARYHLTRHTGLGVAA